MFHDEVDGHHVPDGFMVRNERVCRLAQPIAADRSISHIPDARNFTTTLTEACLWDSHILY
jgi:hypothetical protein